MSGKRISGGVIFLANYFLSTIPTEQFDDDFITEGEFREIGGNAGGNVVLENTLEYTKKIDAAFARGRLKDIDVAYLSQSYFEYQKEQYETAAKISICSNKL